MLKIAWNVFKIEKYDNLLVFATTVINDHKYNTHFYVHIKLIG